MMDILLLTMLLAHLALLKYVIYLDNFFYIIIYYYITVIIKCMSECYYYALILCKASAGNNKAICSSTAYAHAGATTVCIDGC